MEDLEYRFFCSNEDVGPGLAFVIFDEIVDSASMSYRVHGEPDLSDKADTFNKSGTEKVVCFDSEFSLEDLLYELPLIIREETEITSITGFSDDKPVFHSEFFSEYQQATITTLSLDDSHLTFDWLLEAVKRVRKQLKEHYDTDLKATVIPTGPITSWKHKETEIGVTEGNLWIHQPEKTHEIPIQFIESFSVDEDSKEIHLNFKRFFPTVQFLKNLVKFREINKPPCVLPYNEEDQIKDFQEFLKYFISTYHNTE